VQLASLGPRCLQLASWGLPSGKNPGHPPCLTLSSDPGASVPHSLTEAWLPEQVLLANPLKWLTGPTHKHQSPVSHAENQGLGVAHLWGSRSVRGSALRPVVCSNRWEGHTQGSGAGSKGPVFLMSAPPSGPELEPVSTFSPWLCCALPAACGRTPTWTGLGANGRGVSWHGRTRGPRLRRAELSPQEAGLPRLLPYLP
jgi:hypothetical protein